MNKCPKCDGKIRRLNYQQKTPAKHTYIPTKFFYCVECDVVYHPDPKPVEPTLC